MNADDLLVKAQTLSDALAMVPPSAGWADVVDGLIEEVERLRAAADACEAERNPRTTDDEPIAAWLHPSSGTPRRYRGQDEAQMLALGWEPVFRRRPVSSEDVHREDAE